MVYLPGHHYIFICSAFLLIRREVIAIHTWSNVRMHTYCDVMCVMHYITPTSQYIKHHIPTHYTCTTCKHNHTPLRHDSLPVLPKYIQHSLFLTLTDTVYKIEWFTNKNKLIHEPLSQSHVKMITHHHDKCNLTHLTRVNHTHLTRVPSKANWSILS